MGQRKRIGPLPEARLRGLTTPRLLAYQRRMLELRETRSTDGVWPSWRPKDWIFSKDDPRWTELRALVRTILGEREHVEDGDGE